MVDSTTSGDTFIPLDLTADQLPAESVTVQSQDTSGTLQPQAISNPISDLGESFAELFNNLGTLAGDVGVMLSDVAGVQLHDVLKKMSSHVNLGLHALDSSSWLATTVQGVVPTVSVWSDYTSAASSLWNWIVGIPGGAFYTAFLKFGLDVDMDKDNLHGLLLWYAERSFAMLKIKYWIRMFLLYASS